MSHWRWRLWIQADLPPIEQVAIEPQPKPRPPRFRPHVAKAYPKPFVPRGALHTAITRCWECGDEHAYWERREWNGTHSQCPKCGSEINCYPQETFEWRNRQT